MKVLSCMRNASNNVRQTYASAQRLTPIEILILGQNLKLSLSKSIQLLWLKFIDHFTKNSNKTFRMSYLKPIHSVKKVSVVN